MQITYIQRWFDVMQSYFANIPNEFWFVAFFIPVALALFSRRTIVLLGSVLTAGIALFVMLKPELSYVYFHDWGICR